MSVILASLNPQIKTIKLFGEFLACHGDVLDESGRNNPSVCLPSMTKRQVFSVPVSFCWLLDVGFSSGGRRVFQG